MAIKQISRRTFLYAGGAVIALPFLEAMLPFRRTALAVENRPLRYAVIFFPHGTTQLSDWEPTKINGGLRMNASGMLDPLNPYVGDLSFVHNLAPDSWALHPGGVTTVLTGGFGPTQNKVFTCRTIDQLIADKLQGPGRIHSIAMGSDELSGGESVVSGVYGSNISWLDHEKPNTRYISNSQIFDLIVPGGASSTTPPSDSTGPTQGQVRQSVLDFAKDSLTRLNKQLGSADQQLMDQYLTNLREVEKKIQETTVREPTSTPPTNNLTLSPAMAACSSLNNKGACTDYPTDMDIKMDLMALAFQADRTRVMTHMFDPEPGYRNMSFIPGVSGQAHPNSHWRTDPDKMGPRVRKATTFYASKFARLLSRLKSMNEVGGTVLDNSLIFYTSSMVDGHNHSGGALCVLAGKAGGNITTGNYTKYSSYTNISYFHLTIAKKFGVDISNYSGAKSTLNIG